MASFEEKDLVDYAVQKFENLVRETDKSVEKDLERIWTRLGKVVI